MGMVTDTIAAHPDGVRTLADNARAAGASEAEITEAVEVAYLYGGTAALVMGVDAFGGNCSALLLSDRSQEPISCRRNVRVLSRPSGDGSNGIATNSSTLAARTSSSLSRTVASSPISAASCRSGVALAIQHRPVGRQLAVHRELLRRQ